MLPAVPRDAISLADVVQSCFSAVLGAPNRLELAPVQRGIVVLIDGLGVEALRARAGHARALSVAIAAAVVVGKPLWMIDVGDNAALSTRAWPARARSASTPSPSMSTTIVC